MKHKSIDYVTPSGRTITLRENPLTGNWHIPDPSGAGPYIERNLRLAKRTANDLYRR